MGKDILTEIISGVFALISSIATVYLKNKLDKKDNEANKEGQDAPTAPRNKSLLKYALQRLFLILGGAFCIGGINHLVVNHILGGVSFISNPSNISNPSQLYSLIPLVLLLILVILLLVQCINHNVKYSGLLFQIENLTLWSGYIFGESFIHSMHDNVGSKLWIYGTLYWLSCAVIGELILRLVRKKQKKRLEENAFRVFGEGGSG